MKNVIITILAIVAVVAGYVALSSKLRMPLSMLEGKTATIQRGDLTLPINATGEVRPARRVEIKAEASGEVIEIAKQAGDRVAVGDLLIRLQRDDEQRNVDRAGLDLDIAEARLEDARLRLQQARTADLRTARARVDELAERVRMAKFRMKKLAELPEHQRNDEEMLLRETNLGSSRAQLGAAEANLETAEIAVPRFEQALKQAVATYETAKTVLGDAEKRLSKTNILAPIPGIVSDVRVQIGTVIQGGRTTLTGGTVLVVVVDMDKLVVRAEVDEADIGRVLDLSPAWARPGHDQADQMPDDWRQATALSDFPPIITVESFRNEEFTGIIERIYPEPRSISGVVTYLTDVVITSDNRSRLLPGMRADVRFTSEHLENVVLCPNEAIRPGSDGELGVFIPKAGSTPEEKSVEFISCKFGLSDGNHSHVKDGLGEGDVVYVKLPPQRDRDKERQKKRRG